MVDGDRWWWVVVDIFWLVVGASEWLWVVVVGIFWLVVDDGEWCRMVVDDGGWWHSLV